MEYKAVYYGGFKTIQVKCPKCGLWQFKSDRCECGEWLKRKILSNKKPPEIRCEQPTWRDRIPDSKRKLVFERDDYICQYCGTYCFDSFCQDPKAVVLDHIIPFSIGGTTEVSNLITSCRECNSIKSDSIFDSFEEAREYILDKKKNE